ncbi:hypothetical protein ACHAWF_001661, partial [Thalassiosira exigua]
MGGSSKSPAPRDDADVKAEAPPPSDAGGPAGAASRDDDNQLSPVPKVPPGHLGPVRTPHPHDVLSGRGGRINSHPGNVRFRSAVDSLKREYLDPRTKKVEKARIAAQIASEVRARHPPGRFLKEDPHTGLWVEIGDERAWKKAGQALRESAPEIRAERQARLQMMAGMDPVSAAVEAGMTAGTGMGGMGGMGGGGM